MIGIRNRDYVFPVSHILQKPLDPLIPYLHRSFEYLWMLGPFFLVFLVLMGVVMGLEFWFKRTIILLVWALLPILVSSEFSKTMTARYIYFCFPYFCILASLSFRNFFKDFLLKIKTRLNSNAFVINLLAFLFFLGFLTQSLTQDYKLLNDPQSADLPRSERSGYLEEWTSGWGIREVSSYIRKEAKFSNAKIVIGTEGYFGTLPDGLQMYLADLTNVIVIGVGLPIKDIPESLVESKKAGNKTFLVVNSSRFLGDYQRMNLKLIESYPKAIKPDGTRESLFFFEIL